MVPLVVDSSVLVASFLEGEINHQKAAEYIDGLERRDYVFHLSVLAVVEVVSALNRRSSMALLLRAKRSLQDWERDGKIVLYELDRQRMDNATSTAEEYQLRGADSVIASLADELDMSLKTFDTEVLARFLRASV